MAVVEIERATGLVRVVDYFVVEDCGVLINPDIVDGQIRGEWPRDWAVRSSST